MKRSRLKNIINKSKESSKLIGNPFDKFKKSLPIEVDDNYRLEAAWKAYGSPKDYKEALWQGMIQPIDENNVKLPSIGYNEETDEYEYLNKGRENETVNKDIRVWDNDIIPFVKELKQGGFIRTFDEEKDCWKYSKQQKTQTEQEKVIEQFQEGGKPKPKFEDWYKTVPKEKSNTEDYDLEKAYNELSQTDEGWKQLENFRTIPEAHLSGDYKKPNHPTYGGDYGYGWHGSDQVGWTYYVSPRQIQEFPERTFDWYKEYWNRNEPHSILNYNGQTYKVTPYYKQGGQMNVIPEGALHARKNNMELAKEGEITHKGVPVVDNDGVQQAEVEKEEWTMTKELTEDVEAWYRKYYDEETSQKEKDELAIKCGKRITKELLHNTDDRANLIAKMLEEEE